MNLERINVWQYKTSQGTKWALEVRSLNRGGKNKRKIQRRGFDSKPEAINIARQLRIDIDNSSSSVKQRTFEQFLVEYLDELKFRVQEHTRANYSADIRRWVLPTLGSKKLCDVHQSDISQLLSNLRSSGLRPATVNTVRARLIGLFSYAEELGLVSSNPARRANKYREDLSESLVMQPLNLEEAQALLSASKGSILDVFVHIALILGLRKGEIRALKWADVDLENGWITIDKSRGARNYLDSNGVRKVIEDQGPTKTLSSVRRAPLPMPVLESLMRRRERLQGYTGKEDFLVCGDSGRPLGTTQLSKEFSLLLNSVGLRHIRIHDIRHPTAVLAMESGVRLEEASQALGPHLSQRRCHGLRLWLYLWGSEN